MADVDRASLTSIVAANNVTSRAAVITTVAATEACSEHPPAKVVVVCGESLVDSAAPEGTVETFESTTGQGVRVTVALSGGQKYTV